MLLLAALAVCLGPRAARSAPPTPGEKSTIKLLSAPGTRQAADFEVITPDSDRVPLTEPMPELFPYAPPTESDGDFAGMPQMSEPFAPQRLEDYGPESQFAYPQQGCYESDSYFSKLGWLGFKHSSTDGRSAGIGTPLRGTSWLNRPYYLGFDLGAIWISRPIETHITTDADFYGSLFAGCDWDYYWGSEIALHRATPELINEEARDAPRGDRMWIWNANLLYYPWGDSVYRPYWRIGIGAMEIDFPTDGGYRQDEALWNIPIGIGIKYPVRRWLAARAEIVDQIGLGNSGVNSQHDITFTLGLEWRLGAHPRSYWPWNPSRHIW